MKKVAIGGGQGFWGDSPDAAIHMIRNADIQYMGCDYLAELTLSIMAKQQLKDPTKGFAPDFTTRILKEAGKEAWDKHIRICTNAGGMNINGCVDGIPAHNIRTLLYQQFRIGVLCMMQDMLEIAAVYHRSVIQHHDTVCHAGNGIQVM